LKGIGNSYNLELFFFLLEITYMMLKLREIDLIPGKKIITS